jgi:16S rRNA (guanine(966)-N(2))-methyltransferase RsmD
VTGFVRGNASKNDGYDSQIARAGRIALSHCIVGPEDKHGQDEKREMNADIHAKQASNRDGPTSHKPSLLLFYMDGYIEGGIQGHKDMRVIAGKYRSRPLRSLRGMDVRPTSDRLRETLFNVLTAGNPAALEGSVWLDLFAGTGAVGIEALSRGAKEVYFVEHAATAADAIRRNLEGLGVDNGFKILQEELPRAFWRMERQHVAADFVFIDPPYRMQDAYMKTLRALADSSLVWAMSVVVAEHEKRFDPGEEFGPLRRFRHLAQGSAALSFYRMSSAHDMQV